jgi:hypothetical protein
VWAEVSHANREAETAVTKLVAALRNCFSEAPDKNAQIFLLLVKEKNVYTSRNTGSGFVALGKRPALQTLELALGERNTCLLL